MNIIPFIFLTFFVGAEVFSSLESTDEPSASNEKFENELEEGYQLLKGEPHAEDTKILLQQLHMMEPEIAEELTLSPERNAELQEQMRGNNDRCRLSPFLQRARSRSQPVECSGVEHSNYEFVYFVVLEKN
uniref:Urotensin-2B n=1 Tax=Angiostrongylus cantonensis TaxID=6313 RepID=A0A0K0DA45_ANGCA